MALPALLAGVGIAAAAAYFINDEVSSSQNKAIESGKDEAANKAKEKIYLTLDEELERYKVKLKLHLYIAIACFVIFCVAWLIFIPLAWLIAIVVSLASMYLLAEIFVSLLYEDTIKIFCKAFWRIWEKDKLQFTRKIISHAAHEALKSAIEYRIRRSSMEKEIRSRIDQEIEELSFAHMLAYDVFGDSRSALTEKIYQSALNAIDYESIFERIKGCESRMAMMPPG